MGPLSVKDDGPREQKGVGLAEHNCSACGQQRECCCSGEPHLRQLRGEARQTRALERPPPVPPPEPEWREIVANMRTLALGDQQQQQQSLATARSRPKPTRSRSDQTFNHPGGKRTREECFSSKLGPTFASGNGCDSDDDDSAGLGAPPPLPPTLKRAKACSYSPTSSTARKFSKRNENPDDETPRQ
ncbi:unnamed protein product [Ectocarpus fasciculatus]